MATVRTPVEFVVVTSPGCHLCEDALDALAGHGEDVAVRRVDGSSDEGSALVARYRPVLSPLVLVDGAPFSAGRLPRGKLRRLLDARH